MGKGRAYWIALGLAAVLLLTATPALAHHETGDHWPRESNPITLVIEENVPRAWENALAYAVDQWDDASALRFIIVSGDGDCTDYDSGRIEVCAKSFGKTGWLGRGGRFIDGDHIFYGYAEFNLSYDFTRTKRNFVACHEIGHALGLGHRDGTGNSCMVSRWGNLTNKPAIADAHDIEAIDETYAHLDT